MNYAGGRGLLKALLLAGISLMGVQQAWSGSNGGAQSNVIPVIASLNPGDVMLRWTATGDDDYVGRATGYDIRYAPIDSGPIVHEADWNQAIQLSGEPTPSWAGQLDSMLVTGLTPGASYYFNIKAYDEVGHYSGLSNSPLVQAADYFLAGDANASGDVGGLDVVYLVNYLKGEGPPPPEPILRGDANGDCQLTGLDANYLLNYLKGSGPEPRRGNCRLAMEKKDSPGHQQ